MVNSSRVLDGRLVLDRGWDTLQTPEDPFPQLSPSGFLGGSTGR